MVGSAISKSENGLTSPEVYTMARIADILGVSVSVLVDISKNKE
ncbi:MAG: helix-turn-helix transcriptional regulator [Oligoflexia bacterium]|nr:helix-turn-helix transcriptional regulator [Oligoflexia bacterium]